MNPCCSGMADASQDASAVARQTILARAGPDACVERKV